MPSPKKALVSGHAGHVEEVLERVGGAEELSKGRLRVSVECVVEVGAATTAHATTHPT